jgi:hypothetical protein
MTITNEPHPADIIEVLKGYVDGCPPWSTVMRDNFKAAIEEVEQLRAALQPFAKAAGLYDPVENDGHVFEDDDTLSYARNVGAVTDMITVGDLWRAARLVQLSRVSDTGKLENEASIHK